MVQWRLPNWGFLVFCRRSLSFRWNILFFLVYTMVRCNFNFQILTCERSTNPPIGHNPFTIIIITTIKKHFSNLSVSQQTTAASHPHYQHRQPLLLLQVAMEDLCGTRSWRRGVGFYCNRTRYLFSSSASSFLCFCSPFVWGLDPGFGFAAGEGLV